MKKKILLILALTLTILSCDKDRCDEGYKPHNANGHEICIPEFITGKNYNFKLGNKYIHPKLGLITLENGVWKNEDNSIVVIK